MKFFLVSKCFENRNTLLQSFLMMYIYRVPAEHGFELLYFSTLKVQINAFNFKM